MFVWIRVLTAAAVLGGAAAVRANVDVPNTMMAVNAHAAAKGGDFSQTHWESVSTPKPGRGQVLVRVNASSVNPVDWKIVEAPFAPGLPRFPHVVGFDMAGTVVALGEGCKRLKVGDEVWADLGLIQYLHGGELGAYAEFALAEETQTGLKPRSISMREAATLPLVGLTNLQALRKTGAPWSGNRTVLITSGSGGTGFLALQMAKHVFGAGTVITSSTGAGIPFCTSMGADKVYDYKVHEALDAVPDDSLDVVYDNYGAPGTADKAMPKLRTGGVFIFLPGENEALAKHPKQGVTQLNFGLVDASKAADLDAIAAMVDGGKVKAYVSQTFAMADFAAAFDASIAGDVIGKIGLTA